MFYKVWLPLIMLVSFTVSVLLASIYQLVRRPAWADTAANIRIPLAGWIIAAIIAVAVGCLAFLDRKRG